MEKLTTKDKVTGEELDISAFIVPDTKEKEVPFLPRLF